ncbi:lipopolysaccharide biosynthesis protein [Myxacorys almedinensis]|uniref:Oligosaccharide flippase family protein n=1 Tax=Myxacorys almedinensis A TaxID=2690445 RepID=A0A8J8CH26_9CYAN|nr:lipopolysaccharide biosynthesis protein [Myxacorys almedinensis]NDJ16219.1 oligosaccharide flippase family protein [Myxacorys almedinensis A]
MSRTKRSAASFSSLLLVQITSVGIGVVSTPLLLKWLGDERYGAFRVATDLSGYLLLLELGIGGGLCAMLANAISRDAHDEVQITIGVGIRAYLQVLCLMMVAGIVLGCFITQIVSVKGTISTEFQWGYWINLLCLLFLPVTAFQLLIDASQRNYIKNIFLIVQSVLITSLSLWFAWMGFGIPGQFLAVLIGNAVFSIAISWDSFQRYPNLMSAILHPAIATARKTKQHLWRFNVPMLILHLAWRIGLLTDNIVVSYFLGSASVVPFVITQRLAGLVQLQLQSVGLATWAALADFHGKDDHTKFNTQLVELTQIIMLIGIALSIPVLTYNAHFITLWMGRERFGGWELSTLVAFSSVLRGVLHLWEWCFIGTGNLSNIVRLSVVGTLVNLIVSLMATSHFGIVGPVLGTVVSLIAVYSWWMPRLLQQTFGTSPLQLFAAIARPFAVGLPYGAIALWVATHHTPWGWLGLASEMAGTALLYLAIAWWFVLKHAERAIWRDRLLKLLPTARLNIHPR